MVIENFQNLNCRQIRDFFKFIKLAANSQDPAAKNMYDKNWRNLPNTLPFLLYKTNRFHNGIFVVVYCQDELIACGGLYSSDFSSRFALAGTRMWIKKEFRNKFVARNYLLPYFKKYAIENNYQAIGVCFNEYNKNLAKTWFKTRLGEKKNPRTWYYLGFDNLELLDHAVSIKNTKQYLLYEKIDKEFVFDWSTIAWKE
jgi:hypothetical protein